MKLNSAWKSSDALFRLFGHPRILRMAASLLGDDFVAHGGGVIVKPPRLGPAFAWHQDGTAHWDHAASGRREHSHGLTMQLQLRGADPTSAVFALPGSHRAGQVDIASMVASHGDRLPGAVPM